jgi:hypothetical protein
VRLPMTTTQPVLLRPLMSFLPAMDWVRKRR